MLPETGIKMEKIILASASPRRRELLSLLGLDFDVIPARGDETITKTDPKEVVKELAYQKASEVWDRVFAENADGETLPEKVIGADTIVVYRGEIFGKPANEADAKRMLTLLQGQTHQVYTGVCVLSRSGQKRKAAKIPAGKKEKTPGSTPGSVIAEALLFAEKTDVTMYPVTEKEIEAYIRTGEPMDKAGAYAIQGISARFIQSICGDYNNVVGLPIARLWQECFRC